MVSLFTEYVHFSVAVCKHMVVKGHSSYKMNEEGENKSRSFNKHKKREYMQRVQSVDGHNHTLLVGHE